MKKISRHLQLRLSPQKGSEGTGVRHGHGLFLLPNSVTANPYLNTLNNLLLLFCKI